MIFAFKYLNNTFILNELIQESSPYLGYNTLFVHNLYGTCFLYFFIYKTCHEHVLFALFYCLGQNKLSLGEVFIILP